MKSVLLTLAAMMILGLCTASSAQAETPYARECRLSGGQQWSLNMETQFDTTLCLFGSAAVGIAELAQYKWGQGLALSLKAFLKQTSSRNPVGLCDIVGAAYRPAKDTDGSVWELCQFPDGSIVELNTLAGGVNDPYNAALVEALQ